MEKIYVLQIYEVMDGIWIHSGVFIDIDKLKIVAKRFAMNKYYGPEFIRALEHEPDTEEYTAISFDEILTLG